MSYRGFAASVLLIVVSLSPFADAGAGQCEKPDVRYELLRLGDLGAPGGYASDVNELGQVTGASSRSDEVGRAFVWDCLRGMRSIGSLSEDHFASSGQHINNRGQVVGQSSSEESSSIFLWDRRNRMRFVANGYPYSLSDRSEVTYNSSEGPVLWTEASGGVPLLLLSGVNYREAYVNDHGQVGGYGFHPDSPTDRFLVWTPTGGLQPRGVEPSDAYMTVLRGFNDRSEFLGTSFLLTGAAVPFIVDRSGEFRRLLQPRVGHYYEAVAFNSRRQVIGFSFASGDAQSQQPFIWDAQSGVRNLNMLVYGRVPSNTEDRVTSVHGMNEWGWIAGAALTEGRPYSDAALLVPVPGNDSRYRTLSRLRGPALCAALASSHIRLARRCGG
jgi:hypothetical protein